MANGPTADGSALTSAGAYASPDERAVALSFLENLAAELSNGVVDLPCFPNVVIRISAALANPDTTSDNIVTIVGTEPRLAARLLQTANNAAFNTSGKPLSDLRGAITRVGQPMVLSIAMSYALHQMQNEDSLAPIKAQLADLWDRSIAVAALCQLIAERTRVPPATAFLTGLLHGIGGLYILTRAAGRSADLKSLLDWMELLAGWQAPIGKAVLENWGFSDDMCEAVCDQGDVARKWRHDANLTDVLIVSLVIARSLHIPEPRSVDMQGIAAFASIGLSSTDCQATLVRADRRIALVFEALK